MHPPPWWVTVVQVFQWAVAGFLIFFIYIYILNPFGVEQKHVKVSKPQEEKPREQYPRAEDIDAVTAQSYVSMEEFQK